MHLAEKKYIFENNDQIKGLLKAFPYLQPTDFPTHHGIKSRDHETAVLQFNETQKYAHLTLPYNKESLAMSLNLRNINKLSVINSNQNISTIMHEASQINITT